MPSSPQIPNTSTLSYSTAKHTALTTRKQTLTTRSCQGLPNIIEGTRRLTWRQFNTHKVNFLLDANHIDSVQLLAYQIVEYHF